MPTGHPKAFRKTPATRATTGIAPNSLDTVPSKASACCCAAGLVIFAAGVSAGLLDEAWAAAWAASYAWILISGGSGTGGRSATNTGAFTVPS
ncbi:hypothetical protein NST07_18005 [Paenibacillus sp. FSL L8-0340]|uniref:hypothetical protein n=1 Tax=Paenibacillus sp. FSL L8-0340 TaxID=2954685 RepID=UPI0031582608